MTVAICPVNDLESFGPDSATSCVDCGDSCKLGDGFLPVDYLQRPDLDHRILKAARAVDLPETPVRSNFTLAGYEFPSPPSDVTSVFDADTDSTTSATTIESSVGSSAAHGSYLYPTESFDFVRAMTLLEIEDIFSEVPVSKTFTAGARSCPEIRRSADLSISKPVKMMYGTSVHGSSDSDPSTSVRERTLREIEEVFSQVPISKVFTGRRSLPEMTSSADLLTGVPAKETVNFHVETPSAAKPMPKRVGQIKVTEREGKTADEEGEYLPTVSLKREASE
ncbi:MAG: hypothetical protein M1817_000604 [Caeruleum heppii]|nr:MAG: hypothetical protein M1817_000604 [Caeruleum heppii]